MHEEPRERGQGSLEDVDALIVRARISSWETRFAALMSEMQVIETKHRLRKRRWNFGMVVALVPVVAGLVATMITSQSDPDSVFPWVLTLCAVPAVWILGMNMGLLPTALAISRADDRRARMLRERPTEENLDRERSQRWHDAGKPVVSLRQRQHYWYQDQTDLNWRDRERAESMGLDVHTYVANVLNHDPD